MFFQDIKSLNLKDNIIYYLLLAFCALLPFQFALNPTSDVDLAVVRVAIPLLFIAWFISTIKRGGRLFEFNRITCLFVLYMFLAIFSLFFAHNILWSLRKLLFLFSVAPIYFISLSILKTPQKKRTTIYSLVCGATVLAFLAIMQFVSQFIFGIDRVYNFLATKISPFFLGQTFSKTVQTYPSWLVSANDITYMRATAIFPDPHMLSYFLGMLIPWSIYLLVTSKKNKVWLSISTFSLILADIFTFTRGGYIALIASGIVIIPLVSRKTAVKIASGAFVLACLFLLVPHNPVGTRLLSSFDTQEGSNVARLSNWQQAFLIISSNPFGVGIGNYSLSVDPNATYREPIYAHNLYLDIAAELGIPTLLVFIAMLFLLFKDCWIAAKKNVFYIAGAASITVFAVHDLVENPFYSVHVFPLFLIIITLVSTAHKYEKNPDN